MREGGLSHAIRPGRRSGWWAGLAITLSVLAHWILNVNKHKPVKPKLLRFCLLCSLNVVKRLQDSHTQQLLTMCRQDIIQLQSPLLMPANKMRWAHAFSSHSVSSIGYYIPCVNRVTWSHLAPAHYTEVIVEAEWYFKKKNPESQLLFAKVSKNQSSLP